VKWAALHGCWLTMSNGGLGGVEHDLAGRVSRLMLQQLPALTPALLHAVNAGLAVTSDTIKPIDAINT